jgi:hypothetical protein
MTRKCPIENFNAQRAVYSGRDRLGTFQQDGDMFVARDRRDRVIGKFDAAHEAIEAVLQAGAP